MDKFCKSRDKKDLKSLTKIQTLIVEYYAKYCIKYKKGDIILSNIILNKKITKQDLIDECKRLGIKGYSNKSISQLEILCNKKNKPLSEFKFSDIIKFDPSKEGLSKTILKYADDKTTFYKIESNKFDFEYKIRDLYKGYKHPILILYTTIKDHCILLVTELINFDQQYAVLTYDLSPIGIEVFKYYKKIFNFIIEDTKNSNIIYDDFENYYKTKKDNNKKQNNQDNYYSNEKSDRIKFCTKILCDNKITDKKQLHKYSLIHHPDKYEGNNKEENTDKYKDVITCWNELKDDKFVCK